MGAGIRFVWIFRSASRKFIRATPNITALLVPLEVPRGMTIEPRSIWARGLPSLNLVFRIFSVSDSRA
jgi:hypothetical protein